MKIFMHYKCKTKKFNTVLCFSQHVQHILKVHTKICNYTYTFTIFDRNHTHTYFKILTKYLLLSIKCTHYFVYNTSINLFLYIIYNTDSNRQRIVTEYFIDVTYPI